MENSLEVSLVVETYTHGEFGSFDRLTRSLEAASKMIALHGRGELLVIEMEKEPELLTLLNKEFPQAIRVQATGMSYDQAKMLAASKASGKYVLFQDGDCLPSSNWLEDHLNTLRNGANASGGFTRYEGGFFAAIQSIMDFGFLIPRKERILECYAFNNSGFLKKGLMEIPIPEGEMRCRCFAHAQLLKRFNKPVMMVPNAVVDHEIQPVFPERFRQGYDRIAACWLNPELAEAKWLKLNIFAAPIFYAFNVYLDWRRMLTGYRSYDLNLGQMILSLPFFPLFRLIDLAGMISALLGQRQSYGLSDSLVTPNCSVVDQGEQT